ncbi:hypothetical protein GCM10009680_43560 [Streptomyces yatensis]|uniref:Uncharacterized protein n=1 Tax=Streptomyces yatensis TaxID=155177 RepID=A0ABP4U3K3_9ACTN
MPVPPAPTPAAPTPPDPAARHQPQPLVARAEGAALGDEVPREIVDSFQSYAADMGTSSLADREANRPLPASMAGPWGPVASARHRSGVIWRQAALRPCRRVWRYGRENTLSPP